MKITNDVNDIIIKAYKEAKDRHSEYITPEHLLYAATFNESFKDAVDECGGSIENLRYNLSTYIKTYVGTTTHGEPQESLEFQRVILTADEQVKYSGKDVIDVDHILAAFYTLEDSYALYYLQQEGIERRNLLYYMCHSSVNEEEQIEKEGEKLEEIINDTSHEDEKAEEEKIKKKKEDTFLNKFTVDLIQR